MNTDKILYLHIGMPKTGTSSLQLFLMQNPEALAQNNCSYPMMPGRYPMVSANRNAHFLVGKIMNADGSADMEKTKEIEKQSFELLEQVFQRTDRVILSDEAIWNTYKGDHPECLEKIRAFCERHGIALKLIVYLRRQDQYLESYWKQQIRRKGVTWKWDRMVKQTPRYIVLDYYRHLQVLAGFAGKENIIVQPYYEENFDLCSDFLRVLGITDMDAFEPLESKVNLSLNNNYAEIKRILNGLLSDEPSRWNREQCWLEKLVVDCSRTEKKQYESSMFSVEERQKFIERFGEINQRIAREYMGQETLFDARPEKELPEWKKDNDLQYEDTILFFGKALLDLKREQDLQRRRLQELEGKKNILRRIVNKCRMLL